MRSEKRLARLASQANDVSPEALRAALIDAGFELRSVAGSHWTFKHPRLPSVLTVPYRRPLKPVYVRKALEAIREVTDEPNYR